MHKWGRGSNRGRENHITGVTEMHCLKTVMRQKLHAGDREVKQYKVEREENKMKEEQDPAVDRTVSEVH